MTARITLDKAGRVVIPKPLRDELNLGPGDALQLEAEGEKITLRPVRGAIPLRKERGIWVYRTGQTLSASTTNDVLRKVREERDQQNLGKLRRRRSSTRRFWSRPSTEIIPITTRARTLS
jgi:AbrB family looped-hinge helix DNA binding protein